MYPITFSVSYTLKEYLDFVKNHALVVTNSELATRGKPTLGKMPIFVLPFILLPAAVGFYFKKRDMPVCDFKIDALSIVRTTADGPYEMPWEQVVSIYKYPKGYLVSSAAGAFPLPHRCLDSAQHLQLEALIDKRLSELGVAT